MLKNIIEKITTGSLTKPEFIKFDSEAKHQLEELKALLPKAEGEVRDLISQDIKMVQYGIVGEDSIAFELSNAHVPMLILHDLYLEHDGLNAQIDYLIITRKFALVVECKNLIGNIEVNNNGDFIRTFEFNGRYKKEGIYSPITQNKRHLDLIKRIRLDSKQTALARYFASIGANNFYKSVVVLANPKTVINMKFAPREVKDQIIRSDQLINYIKKNLDNEKSGDMSITDMYEFAHFFNNLHKEKKVNYLAKYMDKIDLKPKMLTPIDQTEIYNALKSYRLTKSRELNIKPYFIFNNAEMEDLINKMPKNVSELLNVNGFGPEKVKKYGQEIIDIVKLHNS
jgi:hypothetical protein